MGHHKSLTVHSEGMYDIQVRHMMAHAGPFALSGAVTRYLAIGGVSCLFCSHLWATHCCTCGK